MIHRISTTALAVFGVYLAALHLSTDSLAYVVHMALGWDGRGATYTIAMLQLWVPPAMAGLALVAMTFPKTKKPSEQEGWGGTDARG